MCPPTFTIKASGEDRTCKGVSELREALIKNYQSQSVTIMFKRSTGINMVVYADVKDSSIFESYGENAIIDFDILNSAGRE